PAAVEDRRVRQVELAISRLLRVGVVVSLCVVVLGTDVSFIRHPDYKSVPSELRRLTTPGAAFPQTLGDVWRGVRQFRGQAIVSAGSTGLATCCWNPATTALAVSSARA